MKIYLFLLISITFAYSQDLLLDDLLLEYQNSEELYLTTKKESAGHLILFSRSDLDKMQAYTLNDVLKTMRFFNLQMTKIGRTTLVQSGNKEISNIPIKFFLNSHELVSVTLGDSLGQYGNMSLYNIDHIEIYQSGNSIILGSKPGAVIIKMYTKDAYRENGTFLQTSINSQGSTSLQSIVAKTFDDYSYMANVDIVKNNSNSYNESAYEMNNDNQRGQVYLQFSKKDNYSIEANAIIDKHDMLSGFGKAPIESGVKGKNFYIQANKKFDNNIELRINASNEQISLLNEDALGIQTPAGPINKLDVKLTSELYGALLEKKFINGANNLLVGAHVQQQHFKVNRYKADNITMPILTGPARLDIYMAYLENLYNINENNLITLSAKIDHYKSNLDKSSTENILRLGYVSVINEDLKFKVFAIDSYTYPLFTQTTFSANSIPNPDLKSTNNKRVSAELVYNLNNTTLSLNAGIGNSKDAIVFSKPLNKHINNPEDGEAQRVMLRLDHSFDTNNKLTIEYFQIHKEKYVSPGNGALVQLFNKIGKLDIYNELIYRSNYTSYDGINMIDMPTGYDYSLGITYPYSKKLSVKLKGQNILDLATTVPINGVEIPAIERQAILSIEYTF